MENIFINIGSVIRKNEISRIENHPLLITRNLTKSSKTKKTYDPKFGIIEILVDIDNNVVSLIENDAIYDKLSVIRYALSASDSKVSYLIGSLVVQRKDVLNQISFTNYDTKYLKKYGEILENSIINKYRKTLESNIDLISNTVSIQPSEKNEIVLVVRVKYNNEIKFAHEFIECINTIDEMFLKSSYKKNCGYIFFMSFYNMFNYGKYVTDNTHTMYEESIPYYGKETFLNLYYARNIYNKISFYVNKKYAISIFPDYDNLTIDDINRLTFIGKDIFNFNFICNEIENFIARKVERNVEEKKLIPIKLTFTLYHRYILGKAGYQNMLRLSGIRYNQLLRIRDRIDNIYYPKYLDKETNTMKKQSLFYALTTLYQDINGKSDKYMSTIIHTLQNIYQENYVVPIYAETCLLNNSQHHARIGDNSNFRKIWNNQFNIFKFLKTMENEKFVEELVNNDSYKLGVELSKFESGWKDGRENLKSAIQRFTGNVGRIVNGAEDVRNYYFDLVQRMTRNRIHYGNHNELLSLLQINDDNFEKNKFIMGYFTEKNEYKLKTN